jgi:hypothetical protein
MREELLNLVRNGVRCPESAKTCSDCQYHSTRHPMHCDEEAALVDMLIANGVVIPVRCKDCRYSEVIVCGRYCDRNEFYPNDDDFCSDGERRSEDG